MKSLFFWSIVCILIGVILFFITPFYSILIKKYFKNSNKINLIKDIFLKFFWMFNSISILIFIMSSVTLTFYSIKNKLNKEKKEVQIVLNELNKKQFKIYEIYLNINETAFKKHFANNENLLKNFIFYEKRDSDGLIILFFTKDEIKDFSNIKINDSFKINPTIIKVININELKNMVLSIPEEIDINQVKKILENE